MSNFKFNVATNKVYKALKTGCVLVDRPEYALIELTGAGAAEFLQGQVTNDVVSLQPRYGCYAALLDAKGKMRADMRVLCTDDGFRISIEQPQLALMLDTIKRFKIGFDVTVADLSSTHATLSLLGPSTDSVALGADPASTLSQEEHRSYTLEIAGAQAQAIRTDGGIDLIFAVAAQQAITSSCLSLGAVSGDAEIAEIARLESGRPRYGLDMDTRTIPQEAGINERAVNFNKGCYVGQETVARLYYKGKPNRRLFGLMLSGAARHGDELTSGDKLIGTVGSAVESPSYGWIGLAILRHEVSVGDEIEVSPSGTTAQVVEPGQFG